MRRDGSGSPLRGATGPCLTFLAALALYVPRSWPILAPAGNHGELAAAGASLGVAHPPGFPLAVHLIRLVQLLPLGNLGSRAHLMAALTVALAAALLMAWVRSLTGTGPGLLAAGALALSGGVQAEALAVEVYGLSLLVLIALLALLGGRERADGRRMAGAALLAGLGCSGHPTFLFGLLGALLLVPGERIRRPGRWLQLAPWALLGLGPLLALPIRSAAGTPVDWGSPRVGSLFLAHVGGAQFRHLMFRSGPAEVIWRLRQMGLHLLEVLPAPVWILGLAGLVLHPRRLRRRLAAVALGAILLLAYAANYRIHDIHAYLLPVQLLAALAWVGPAALIPRERRAARTAALLACGLLLALTAEPVDRSREHLTYDYACRLLERVPPEGLLVTQGDLASGAAVYLAVAEGRRPDAVLHDRQGNLLRGIPGPSDASWLELERRLLRRHAGRAVYAQQPLELPAEALAADGLAYRFRPPGSASGPHSIPPVDARPIRGVEGPLPDHEPIRMAALEVQRHRLVRALRDPAFEAWEPIHERCRRIAGGWPSLRYRLGTTLSREGRFDLALPELQAAAEGLPFQAALWNSLAWSRLKSGGDLTRAEQEARCAVGLEADQAAFHHTLGMILLAAGRPDEAVTSLDEARRLEPRSLTYRRDLLRARKLSPPSP